MAKNQNNENIVHETVVAESVEEIETTPNRVKQFLKNHPRAIKVVGTITGAAALTGIAMVALSKTDMPNEEGLDSHALNDDDWRPLVVEVNPTTNTLEVKEV